MIHEVMVLDHGGVDFAFILYGAALKMWVLALLIVGILLPFRTGNPWLDLLLAVGGVLTVGALTGVVESTMARLRLRRLPQLLIAATVSSILAVVLQSR
jgi:formate hydrogenlyase subunit 4